MKLKHNPLLAIGMAAFLNLAPIVNGATMITFNYDAVTEAGVTPPTGNDPWLSATFTTINSSTVSLTLNSNLVDDEFISKLGLNIPQDIYAHTLTWTIVDSSGSFTAPTIGGAWNGGNGTGFPLSIEFAKNNTDRFNLNDSITFNISYSGEEDFSAESFNVLDKSGKVLSIAHIQSIGSKNSSAWVSSTAVIPESSAALLGGIGLLTLLQRRRA